jgi:nucleotide-binding universal stress UspA family protein
MYDEILLPYDGSEGAAAVLHHAAEVARWAGATVRVLYVADTTRDSVTVVGGQTVDALVRRGEEVVAEAVAALDDFGVAHATDVVQGNPAPTIVEYAERYGHDLVVMPTHGREGLSRHLVGSVAEKVVRLSSVPVLTARMRPDETLAFPYESVLVPTDGSEAATRAADHVLSLAAALDATVHVLSVVDDAALGPDVRSATTGEAREAAATEAVAAVADDGAARDVKVVRHVEHGAPVDVIRDCVAANDAHLVGMGTTGRRGTDRILLGSVAEQTVRTAPVPVLTVAPPEG